ncbi:MAG TPA: hypothetical protein VOA41_12365 [Candidatus Dormibacteraeota bacterium]|nr:hypothetical protein [Candidatus Dormibacteraeota bacterium]
MEFSVNRSELLNELNMTQGVIERKTTIPMSPRMECNGVTLRAQRRNIFRVSAGSVVIYLRAGLLILLWYRL